MSEQLNSFTLDGVEYVTIAAAAQRLGRTQDAMRKRASNVRSVKIGGTLLIEWDPEALTKHTPRRVFDSETSRERNREQTRRSVEAMRRAHQALRREFPARYRELRLKARAEIDAARGTLPGDEVSAA